MPGLTGLDVLKKSKERSAKLPAIILTAHDDSASRAQCMACGARAYLCKPVDDRRLFAAIAEAIDSAGL